MARVSNLIRRGFTLIELLIVIGVLAALSVAVVIALNPAELIKQSRDAVRLSDLAALNRAVGIVETETQSSGDETTIYVSLPDTASDCGNLGLPPPPPFWTYNCVTEADLRRVDRNGWLPLDFTSFTGGAPFSALPVDPVNTAASGLYYAYVTGGSYALASTLESQKYLKQSALVDGGSDLARLEVGSDLGLWANASGLSAYWNLDEGTGTSAADSSGNGNNGTLISSPSWTAGKIGNALTFNGSNYVNAGNGTSVNITGPLTVAAWIKTTQSSGEIATKYKYRLLGSSYYGYTLNLGSSKGLFTAYCGTDCSSPSASSANNVDDGAWHYVVGVFDGSRVVTYADGVPGTSQLWSDSLAVGDNNFFIGARRASAGIGLPDIFFNGTIDDVRLYNRALSATEIQAYYNATK